MARESSLSDRLRSAPEGRPEILDGSLFGSQARGEAGGHGDVDVAVYVDATKLPEAPFGYPAELTAALMAALGTNAVDVVVLNDAPPLLDRRVLRDGIRLVVRDPRATTTREGRRSRAGVLHAVLEERLSGFTRFAELVEQSLEP